ncbi:putative tRNA 2'-phosphotransferase [Termitomyces sp. T112]|nr:putative tRNA 2'-phosphotransferase [Termitomyces sp. T112]
MYLLLLPITRSIFFEVLTNFHREVKLLRLLFTRPVILRRLGLVSKRIRTMSAAQTSLPTGSGTESQPMQSQRNASTNSRKKQEKGQKKQGPKQGGGQQSTKLRGLERDSPAVRLSKTISWLLRHGAKNERLPMRPDGYVKVKDLMENLKGKGQDIDFSGLQELVKADSKKRYDLKEDSGDWWIRANQGHSMEAVKLELQPVLSLKDIPTGVAVHGTTRQAWKLIAQEGLSKMTRNHIHFAQGIPGNGVISGMRSSSQILIFLDVPKALDAGIKFFLSDNGVVLSEGQDGLILPDFFLNVQDVDGKEISGWKTAIQPPSSAT